MRGTLTGLVLLALLASSLASGAAPSAPEPGVLYLRPREGDIKTHNFTTVAPTSDEPVAVGPNPPELAKATWDWRLSVSPVNWTLPEGSMVRTVFYLDGLERVVPIADPDHPDALGKTKVQVDVLRANDTYPVASSHVLLDPVWPNGEAGAVEVDLEVTVPRDLEFQGGSEEVRPFFGIRITVTGRMPADDPAVILVGSVDTPSRIEVPGFPMAAFRAWEEAEAAHKACTERILQRLPCKEPVRSEPVPTENGTVAGPGFPGALVATAGGLLVVLFVMRRFSIRSGR